jgi:hypothetical protein
MLKNHFAHCFVGIGAAAGLLLIFGVRAGTLLYLVAVLACPLMMLFMMRTMMGGDGHRGPNHSDQEHSNIRGPTETTGRTR